VIVAHNDFPGIVGEELEWHPLQRLNLVPGCLLKIQTTPPHRHLPRISAHQPILVVTMPGVAVTFKSVIDEMTHRTDVKLGSLLQAENANLTHKDLNTWIEKPEN
jgi:hypothetical protein